MTHENIFIWNRDCSIFEPFIFPLFFNRNLKLNSSQNDSNFEPSRFQMNMLSCVIDVLRWLFEPSHYNPVWRFLSREGMCMKSWDGQKFKLFICSLISARNNNHVSKSWDSSILLVPKTLRWTIFASNPFSSNFGPSYDFMHIPSRDHFSFEDFLRRISIQIEAINDSNSISFRILSHLNLSGKLLPVRHVSFDDVFSHLIIPP